MRTTHHLSDQLLQPLSLCIHITDSSMLHYHRSYLPYRLIIIHSTFLTHPASTPHIMPASPCLSDSHYACLTLPQHLTLCLSHPASATHIIPASPYLNTFHYAYLTLSEHLTLYLPHPA
ncbi:hypothetical protein Pcinc_041641 [Petrolisthes cinctipes]|uniref:Uncharacterized protein n=1 Tax=Petrolisthes cinctipes TaxID=88211 RepID=A0AAE1BJG7_PETCI|nr:hypothetical protein Pcinc_041641 [Petrolisthes cinctipes]